MHKNNFDFVRMFAAFLVIFSHQHVISRNPEVAPIPWHSYGGIGVLIFFALSGYLVSQSWERDPHIVRFAIRRILRIFPAMIVVILACTFAMGPAVTTLPLHEYFQSPDTWGYLKSTLLLSTTDRLPGTFTGNAYQGVNSPIWTIPLELKCYLGLALAGILGFMKNKLFPLTLASIVGYWYFFEGYLFNGVGAELPAAPRVLFVEFALAFTLGMSMNSLRHLWQGRRLQSSIMIAVVVIAFTMAKHGYVAILIAIAWMVVIFGESSTPFVRRFGRFGDLSYGMYIYTFPIQQMVVMVTNNSLHYLVAMTISISISALVSWLSWHYIEKPANDLRRVFIPQSSYKNTSAA